MRDPYWDGILSFAQESRDLYKAHKNDFYVHLLIRWKTTTIIFSFKQTSH